MSRHFKHLSGANDDVFNHPSLRSLINVLRDNNLDPRTVEGQAGSQRSAVNKRSPMSVGFVSGLGGGQHPHHRNHALFLSPETGHHAAISAVVSKSGTATHVVNVGARGPNHLELDGDNTLLVHHPAAAVVPEIAEPVVVHELPPSAAVHLTLPLHDVPKAPTISAVVHQVVESKILPAVVHHQSAPIQPLLLNPSETAIVVVPHIALTHTLTHISPSVDNLRDHIGGYGVGVNFGGAGAGHGYYAG